MIDTITEWVKSLMRKINPPKPPTYPCKECFMITLEQGCSELCDKVEMNENRILDIITEFKRCPDCGSPKFYEGPSGGMSQNMKCAGCGHKFNSGLPLFFERI